MPRPRFRRLCAAAVCVAVCMAGAARAEPAAELAALATRELPTGTLLARLAALRPALTQATGETRAQALQLEAEALIERGAFAAAAERLAEVVTHARTTRNDRAAVAALLARARLAQVRGEPEQQFEAAREAAALAQRSGDTHAQVRAKATLALALAQRRDPGEAMTTAQDAVRLAESTGDPDARALALTTLAVLQRAVPDIPRARAFLAEAHTQAQAGRDQWLQVRIDLLRGVLNGPVEHGYEDPRLLAAAHDRAAALGLLVYQQLALVNLSDYRIITRDWSGARDAAAQAIRLAEAFDAPDIAGHAYLNLGHALVGAGKLKAGIGAIEQAAGMYARTGEFQFLGEAQLALAGAYARDGREGDAVRVFNDYVKARDANDQQRQAQRVAEIQARFDNERRELEIARLQQLNQTQAAEADLARRTGLLLGLLVAVTVGLGAVMAWLFMRARNANALLRQANGQLAHMAERDGMTGLLNRRAMTGWIATRPLPDMTSPGALLVLDIDRFKQVNDNYGHAAGDAVIVEVAHRLAAQLREGDRLARWGGEEFIIYAEHVSAQQLPALAARLLHCVADTPVQTPAGPLHVSASLGMTRYPLAGDAPRDWEAHLAVADQALLRAKRSGRRGACAVLALQGPWQALHDRLMREFDTAVDVLDLFETRLADPRHERALTLVGGTP